MKVKMILCAALATAFLTGCININYSGRGCQKGCKGEQEEEKGEKGEKGEKAEGAKKGAAPTQAQLMAKAKVSKADAEKTARTKVSNGTVKDAEIEQEKGKLIWSFEFTTPGTANITEVNVDAITGAVVDVGTETPQDEAKEQAAEKAHDKAPDKD